jgi:hypothetical protein
LVDSIVKDAGAALALTALLLAGAACIINSPF